MNSSPSKHAQLRALGLLRQQTRWPGYACIGDYHNGAYESEWVSPYTNSAHNVDADVMVLLQDWASDDWLRGPFVPAARDLGHTPKVPTNVTLIRLLRSTFGLELADVFATNLFPFVKLGAMNAEIPSHLLVRAATEFALPQVRVVRPRLVICLGLETFNAILGASALRRIRPLQIAVSNPVDLDGTRFFCQAHTGRLGQNIRNREGVERVSADWAQMRDWLDSLPDLRSD